MELTMPPRILPVEEELEPPRMPPRILPPLWDSEEELEDDELEDELLDPPKILPRSWAEAGVAAKMSEDAKMTARTFFITICVLIINLLLANPEP